MAIKHWERSYEEREDRCMGERNGRVVGG